MPGQFSKDNRPLLPGPYFNEEAIPQSVVQPNSGSIVAIPFTHTWGPFKEAVVLSSFSQFEAIYGKDDSPGRKAVKQAFVGEGVPGYGGAGGVLAYRTGASSAAKASKVLTNTTPATAITLTAKYEGTRGNTLNVTVQDTPSASPPSPTTDIVIFLGTVEVERYTFTDADTPGAVDQINASSEWVTATLGTGGVALSLVANSAFTGGSDGSTLLAADWIALEAALEVERFGVLATDVTDGSILASLVVWAKALNAAGKRFRTVFGGLVGENISTANARSASVNDSDFLNIGVGTVRDFAVVGTDAVPVDLSTAQLAPRIAGILAQRGEVDSGTFARLFGVKIISGPTEAEKLSALKSGTWVIGRDSDPLAPVRMERAVTTYTTKSNPNKPYLIYRNPKFVGTIHGIEMEFTEWMESNIIGKTVVNNKTRDAARAELLSRLQRRVDAKVVQPGPTVEIDQDPPPSDDDEFIALVYGVKFGRSTEQTFNILRVG